MLDATRVEARLRLLRTDLPPRPLAAMLVLAAVSFLLYNLFFEPTGPHWEPVVLGGASAGLLVVVLNAYRHERQRITVWAINCGILIGTVPNVLEGDIVIASVARGIFIIPLVLSGLLLNRTALWTTTGLASVIVALRAIWIWLGFAGQTDETIGEGMWLAGHFIAIYFVVAYFIDSFGRGLTATVRESMAAQRLMVDEMAERERAQERAFEERRLNAPYS